MRFYHAVVYNWICVCIDQEILTIECMHRKTQHKSQKFTRASVVKSDIISLESLDGKMIDHTQYNSSSGVHYWGERNALEGLKWLLTTSCFSCKNLGKQLRASEWIFLGISYSGFLIEIFKYFVYKSQSSTFLSEKSYMVRGLIILSRASGAGSPTDRPGGDKTRDQRISGPVSCLRPGGPLETPPRWHATI